MLRTVYLNGSFIPSEQAHVSIFDRSVLFGDAVYEVAGVLDGKLLDFDSHLDRLGRSLDKLSIPMPLDRTQILSAYRQLVTANRIEEGLVYLQISRGVAERDFVYPPSLTPTVFMFTQPKDSMENEYAATGVKLKSFTDIRWARRDIKTVNLLGQVLTKQAAHEAGAYEALLIGSDGYVTECGATSFFIVKDGRILTRPLSNDILPGVTRKALIELCKVKNMVLEEKPVTLEQVFQADEAFISGASTYVLPVTEIDDQIIGTGIPGDTSKLLRQIYIDHVRAAAI
jgi:D-alanine transaminase